MVRGGFTCDLEAPRLRIANQLDVLAERHMAHVNVLVVEHAQHEDGAEPLSCCVHANGVVSRPISDVRAPEGEIASEHERAECVFEVHLQSKDLRMAGKSLHKKRLIVNLLLS